MTDVRNMRDEEIAFLQSVFGDSVDVEIFRRIDIIYNVPPEDAPNIPNDRTAWASPYTEEIGFLERSYQYAENFVFEFSEDLNTRSAQIQDVTTFVHELAHIV